MINTANIEEARRILRNEKSPRIVLAQNDDFNRKILENGKFDILLSVEKSFGKNKIRQTDSGFNHVLAKIAFKNNIFLGIDLEDIKNLLSKEKAERLARIKQNIVLCRKYKVGIAVKSKNLFEARDFIQSLGASFEQLKKIMVFNLS